MSATSEDQGLGERIRALEAELSRCDAKLRRAIKERKQFEAALLQSSEKYSSVLNEIGEGYAEIDLGGYVTFFNPAMCSITGRRPDQLKGMHYREYAAPESAGRMYRIFSNVFQTGRSETTPDYEIVRPDGDRRFLDLNTFLRRNRKGRPLGFTVIARDVTQRKKTEAALRRNEQAYRLIAENGTEVIETLSLKDHHFTFSSPSVERLRGWSVQETLDQTLADVLPPESQKRTTKTIAEELTLASRESADPRRSRTLELQMRHKEGATLSTEATFHFLRNEAGKPAEILWVIRDISERSTSREEIAHLVYHDPLTGLFNRKSFLERLSESITYATRYSMERAVLYINLNRFKEVNDGWGHETGDALLREVAQRLRRSLRNTDIVSRLAGDEFTVILNNPVDLYPELAAANLLNVLSLPYEVQGGSVDFITPSIGVSLFPWDGRDAETLIKKADEAMRRGKHRQKAAAERDGGGAVHFYEETLSRPRASAGGRSG